VNFLGILQATLGWLLAALSLCGGAYALIAASLSARFMAKTPARAADFPSVSILKPLHHEPHGLAQALETFCVQDYPGQIQLVFGVQDPADPAAAIVRALAERHPAMDIELVVDPRLHGHNRKVSNLINITAAARHEILIQSDADIHVAPDYVGKVVAALARPGVGAVSCLYIGDGSVGLWSHLNAMTINYQFLPNAILGKTLGMADPCFGSTIALTRETLSRIGGFESVADLLADDYEIGRAVRGLGLSISIPPMLVVHDCTEPSLSALIEHEIRWARTVRVIDPAGYAGSLITNPLPLALIAGALLGFSWPALGLILTILGVRIALKLRIDAVTGASAGPWWLIPARDVLSLGVFLASFAGATVGWQGRRYRGGRDGALSHP
jgi:ceramide glucosyltransferase